MTVFVVMVTDWEHGWLDSVWRTKKGAECRKRRRDLLRDAGRDHEECGPNHYHIHEERVL